MASCTKRDALFGSGSEHHDLVSFRKAEQQLFGEGPLFHVDVREWIRKAVEHYRKHVVGLCNAGHTRVDQRLVQIEHEALLPCRPVRIAVGVVVEKC